MAKPVAAVPSAEPVQSSSNARQLGHFNTGLFEHCCDFSPVCIAVFCHSAPCVVGMNDSMLESQSEFIGDPCCNLERGCTHFGCMYFCDGLFGCCYPAYTRGKLRRAYNIPGSCLGDLCCAFWCGPCVVCQTYSELESRRAGILGIGA